MPILTTKDGVYTNAVYGFMNMFFKMLNDIEPTYVAVAFDLKAPTFRHKMYADYKGTRKPMPEELRPQIPLLKDVLRLMGVTVIEKETEVAFGDPVIKKYNNVDKKFVILGGSEVISGEGEYTEDVIGRLVAAYNAEGKEIQAKASSTEKASASATSAQPKPKAKSSSLAGLI
jgi:hypothetical protein